MALSIGVSGASGYTSSTAGTTPARDTQATTNVLLLVHEETGNTTAPTITDNKDNGSGSFVLVGTRQQMSGGSYPGNQMWVFVAMGIAGGAGHTFTASKANSFPSVHVVEVLGTGVALASPSNAAAVDGSSPYTSGTLSPSGAAMLVGCWGAEGTGGTLTATFGNSFTKATEVTSDAFWQGGTGYRPVAAGTYEASVTLTGGHIADVAVKTVAFVESGGGGSVALDGAAVGGASAAGSVSKGVPLTGSATGGGQAGAATLTHAVPLSGAAVSSSAGAGGLTLTVNLAGAAFVQALATAQVDHGVPLAGGATAGGSGAAALSVAVSLSGAAVAQLQAAGIVDHGVPLAGGASAGALAAGSLLGSVLLTGAATAGGSGGASLSLSVPLTAAAVADSLATGVMTLRVPLTADAVAGALAGGSLTVAGAIELHGAAAAGALAAGVLTVGAPSFDTIARIDFRSLRSRSASARSAHRGAAFKQSQRTATPRGTR
nr:hypothetical protein [uncultured Roseateles sp.]